MSDTISRLSEEHKQDDTAVPRDDPPPLDHLPMNEPLLPVLSTGHAVMLASTVMLSNFMMTMAGASALMIVPVMAEYYGVSDLAIQWVASANNLASGCGLLVSGRLADLYGRKQLFILGMSLSLVANIVSGVIPNRIGLCVVRAIAVLGFAIASPAGFGIVGTNFRTEPRRTIAFAAMGAGTPLGAAVGEVLGGVMAGATPRGWQYFYFIIAFFNALPVIGGCIWIPREPAWSADVVDRTVDWVGAAVITVALSLLGFSITQSGLEPGGWSTPYVATLFPVSILMIGLFGRWEYHVEHRPDEQGSRTPPIIKMSLFTRNHWMMTGIILILFTNWAGICGWVYLVAVYYQTLLGASPLTTALYILPAPIVGIACSSLCTVLAPRVRAPVLLVAGAISTGLANILMAVQSPGTLFWKVGFWASILQPAGGDIMVPITSVLISNLCNDDEQSIGGALFQVSLSFSNMIDICLSALIQTQVQESKGLHKGLQTAFWFNAACNGASLLLVFLCLRKVGLAKDVRKMM